MPKFCSLQKMSGASQQNGVSAFSCKTKEDGDFISVNKNLNKIWLHTACVALVHTLSEVCVQA